MEVCLKDTIEGRCSGFEQRIHEAEQRSEECLILLEMARVEAESIRVDLEKQFEDLKLEVNRFFEHENMGDPQGRPDILSGGESHLAATVARGPRELLMPCHGTAKSGMLTTRFMDRESGMLTTRFMVRLILLCWILQPILSMVVSWVFMRSQFVGTRVIFRS
jgi:hypothetical protein